MPDEAPSLQWESMAREKFDNMIQRIPLFHRSLAREVAYTRAELNARERGSALVEEGDIVRAFFSEVPMAFYNLMIKLFEDVGFDYKKYEIRTDR